MGIGRVSEGCSWGANSLLFSAALSRTSLSCDGKGVCVAVEVSGQNCWFGRGGGWEGP